jgi:ribosome-associated protein
VPVGGAAEMEDYVLSHLANAVSDKTAMGARMNGRVSEFSSKTLLDGILSSLDDDKAEAVISIPLAGKSEMADFMVIASGRSTRQVISISDKLVERLKARFGVIAKVEGKDAGDWVLIDAGDVIVHVFRPEVRAFYQLEKMWMAPVAAAQSAKG